METDGVGVLPLVNMETLFTSKHFYTYKLKTTVAELHVEVQGDLSDEGCEIQLVLLMSE